MILAYLAMYFFQMGLYQMGFSSLFLPIFWQRYFPFTSSRYVRKSPVVAFAVACKASRDI